MDSSEIRKKFLKFFESRGHTVVPSSSLIPDDPSVLLTTAGMQQFKPYLTGEADPVKVFKNRNVFSIQKSFRTTDIDEVGDTSHLTFFEMVGNFSFGGYFKERAIPLSFEFLASVDGLGLNPEKFFITAFKGDEEVSRDDEAIRLWQEQFAKVGMKAEIGERIFLYGREKNWWEAGPGPAGPDAEMFYDFGTPHDTKFGLTCHPNCNCGRFVEIGNDVFVQYNKTEEGKYQPLSQKAVDNGRGFERLVMVMQGKNNIFETDLFTPVTKLLSTNMPEWSKRIIADHARGIVFLIADGVRPSNKDQGYILRRLMRRTIPHLEEHQYFETIEPGRSIPIDKSLEDIAKVVIDQYGKIDQYQYLLDKREEILTTIRSEDERFAVVYRNGKKFLERLIVSARQDNTYRLTGDDVFNLVSTYGFSIEWIKDIAKTEAVGLDLDGFEMAFRRHQEISRAGVEKKFGGHGLLLDTGELKAGNQEELKIVTRLHTATHLLNAALHKVLGGGVDQRGSDITPERTRFDFLFARKLTGEELKKIEDLVNEAVQKDFRVTIQEMPLDEAKKSGAFFFYKGHYPEYVKVYTVGDEYGAFSKELCGGPHVTHTGEIGYFRIQKEESSSAGVRRIRAVVEGDIL